MEILLNADSYIDNVHHRVLDREAARLAQELGLEMPKHGRELRVTVNGKPYWLGRTVISHHPRFGHLKRGWVWCVYPVVA